MGKEAWWSLAAWAGIGVVAGAFLIAVAMLGYGLARAAARPRPRPPRLPTDDPDALLTAVFPPRRAEGDDVP